MGLIDRTRAAFRMLTVPSTDAAPPPAPAPAPQSTQDVVGDPNQLNKGNSGLLSQIWFSTSAMYNAVTGIGTRRDPSFYNAWAVARPMGRSELFGMGRNALIVQALSKLGNTATREPWRVKITDPDVEEPETVADEVAAYENRLSSSQHIADAIFKGKQYSNALVLMGIDDGRTFDQPVDYANVKSIKWLTTIDVRYFEHYSLYQANETGFGQVKAYLITDINGVLPDGLRHGPNSLSFSNAHPGLTDEQRTAGQFIVHADRVLTFPTADYLPLPETLQDSFGAFFEAMNGIRVGARESSTVVYKIKNWLNKFRSENSALARAHMAFVDAAKNSMNAWVIDDDNEDVSIVSRNVSGLSKLADPFMVWLAAALAIPVTVLWGVSPGGFGKGEAERETWHEEVGAFQTNVLARQLNKLHGTILVAHDGPRLAFDTKREIKFGDLSPPDEQERSDLRSKAVDDLKKLYDAGVLTRKEARLSAADFADEFLRIELTQEGELVTADAPVGIFTGTLELLKAAALGEVPVDSAQRALIQLAPSSFSDVTAARVFEPLRLQRQPDLQATGETSASAPIPADEEDGEGEPSEVDEFEGLWSTSAPPADADSAKTLANHPELAGRVTGRQITLVAKKGAFPIYRNLYGKPIYSLAEVKRAVLMANGQLPEPVTDAKDEQRYSAALMLRLPEHLARWVPYKEDDPSAPHVTVIYIGKVVPEQFATIFDVAREVISRTEPFTVSVDGVDYFDNDKRVAFARVASTRLADLHEDLRSELAARGIESSTHADYIPHITLAYIQPGEEYDGPAPEGEWTPTSVELWYDTHAFAIPLAPVSASALASAHDSNAVAVRDPFKTEHAARQREPGDFVKETFRRISITEGVDAVVGKLKSKPSGGMVVQTYRFDADKFTPTQARAWLTEHNTPRTALEVAERDEHVTFVALYDEACAFAENFSARFVADLSDEKKQERIDEAFAKFHETVNMGAAELEAWAETEWSKKASLSREPIERNLRLLKKRKEDWTLADAKGAMKTVQFVARMRGNERGKPVKIDGREGPSKRDISLKNWAFDPDK